jgi:cob(I)alamin adenosyltransferase
MTTDTARDQKHQRAMAKQKSAVDAGIAAATEERGVAVLLTGDGKGKSSSGFGMVLRALGYGQKVAVIQFIKGQQLSGEELYIKEKLADEVTFYQMGTGFTWDTQDRTADIAAAEKTWAVADSVLKDSSYDVVLLDELTYMIGYKYLDEDMILDALKNRPEHMSVVVTGRGGGKGLQDIADTVSEVKDIKHAYNSGVKARQGVDF